jgi:hypothetical protein
MPRGVLPACAMTLRIIGREGRPIRARRDAGHKARRGEAAALPRRVQHLGDGRFEPVMRVGDDQSRHVRTAVRRQSHEFRGACEVCLRKSEATPAS